MTDPSYAEMALKFVEHSMWISAAMDNLGDGNGMWDEEDGFFYDVLRLPDGQAQRLKVRSMVGLLRFVRRPSLKRSNATGTPRSKSVFAGFSMPAPNSADRFTTRDNSASPVGACPRS